MPHVASDLKSQVSAYAASRASSQAAKPAFASDNPAATPFDSILDDTARAAPEPRPQRTANDSSARPARAERPKPADRPDRTAKSDNNDKPAAADAAAKTDSADPAKAAGTDSTTKDGKTADPATADDLKAAADDAKQAGDAKPADATAAVVAVAVVIDPAVVAAANAQGDAKTEVKTDTAAIGATAAAAAAAATTQPAATAADGKAELADTGMAKGDLGKAAPEALAALAAKADKADKADAKTDKKAAATDKPATAGKSAGNAPALPHADAADPAAAGEPHKDSGAHARAEETANTHRGVATDTAAAAGNDAGPAIAPKAADLAPPTNLMTAPATAQTLQAQAQTQAIAAPAAAAHAAASDAAVPISGVAFEITSKALAGKGQFDIRLDPPDLGKIHVRLDVDRDGNVITHMVADRTDTLDMLRKDTAGLERALQDAGLKTSDNSLQFSLRDQSANQQQSNGGNANTAHIVVEDEQLGAKDTAQRNYARYNAPTGGLDIRV